MINNLRFDLAKANGSVEKNELSETCLKLQIRLENYREICEAKTRTNKRLVKDIDKLRAVVLKLCRDGGKVGAS